jgi:hypothetical protein
VHRSVDRLENKAGGSDDSDEGEGVTPRRGADQLARMKKEQYLLSDKLVCPLLLI